MRCCRGLALCFAIMALAGRISASAYSASDADAIFSGYNASFFVTNHANSFYKLDNGSGTNAGWWGFAEEIEMAEDVYDRSSTTNNRDIINSLCNGFIWANGSNWTYDSFNDDVTWAVLAFERAYLTTGNPAFRNIAKTNFDAMFSRAWDTSFTGGGLWWTTDNHYKNAPVNGPAIIAACYLYSFYGDTNYLAKAQEIFAWEERVLFQKTSGAVYDGVDTNSANNNNWVSTIDQGTFIGAANFLYRLTGLPHYYQEAILAATCAKNTLTSSDGLLPQYGEGDIAGINGIFARWMARMANEQNLRFAYIPWLNTNAAAAWKVRNTNNISWQYWKTNTPAGTNVLVSWDCSASVVIMQVGLTNAPDALQIAPDIGFTAAVQQGVVPKPTDLILALTNAGATTLHWSLVNTSAWLNVSVTAGTMLAGGTTANVQVSLVPSAVINLPAGRYYTSLVLSNMTSGVVQTRQFTLVVSGGQAPIVLTGYNARVLAPNNATADTPKATAFDLPNSYCLYQAGLNGSTRGLPPDGVFTSEADGTTVFQFEPYGGSNALVLGNTYPSSATLTLETPRALNSLAILACSANGGGQGSLVLNFTNGTHSQTFDFSTRSWFGAISNVAIQGFGRLKLGSGFGAADDGPNNPNLYQTTIDLAALGINQPIASITFSEPFGAGSQQTTGIFAVSGIDMPAAPAISVQPQSVVNTRPSLGASFSSIATGAAPLFYQWYYSTNGKPGTYALLLNETNASLQLNPTLQLTDAGSFVIVVTNAYGAATSSVATLSVYRAPVIVQQPTPTNVAVFCGSSNLFSMSANAAVPVSYFWRLNGNCIPGQTNSDCHLTNLQTASSGDYTVVVSNAFGAVTSDIAVLAVAPYPPYPLGQTVLTDHPLGYWRLDETSGNVAHDYLFNNNGIYSPSVLLDQAGYNLIDTHAAAQFGYLAANNSCVTNIVMDFATTGNGTFSVEAWVNGGVQTSDAGIITKGCGGGGEQFDLDCGGRNHSFRFFVRDYLGNAHIAASSIVPDNRWHHLVGGCDALNGRICLYVDGTNAASGSIMANAGILPSAVPVTIGARQSQANTGYDLQFAGRIEEVAIYGYALSSAQVWGHFAKATNRAPAFVANPFWMPGLVAGQGYSGSISSQASDPNGDPITFAKVSGPSWLSVSSGGGLSGTPVSSNVGTNTFIVNASDPGGLSSTATMKVAVFAPAPMVVTAATQGNSVGLSWSGGIAPYQVQLATNLIGPVWQNVGVPTRSTSLMVTVTNPAAFYRVCGQ